MKHVLHAACVHFAPTFWESGKALGARTCKNNAQGILDSFCMTGVQRVQSPTGKGQKKLWAQTNINTLHSDKQL